MAVLSRPLELLALACLTLLASASSTPTTSLPRQTTEADNRCRADGFSPKPTNEPEAFPFHLDLLKRAETFSTVCGYVSGISTRRLTCGSGYCGKKSIYNAIGCCTTSTVSSGDTLLSGCTFRTQCWDSTAISTRCTGSCVTDSMVLKCSNSANAYCFRYSFTDIGSIILGCTTARLTINAQSTPAAGGVASYSSIVTVKSVGTSQQTVTVTAPDDEGPVTILSTASNGKVTSIVTKVNFEGGGLETIVPTDTVPGPAVSTTVPPDRTGTGTVVPGPTTSAAKSSNVGAIAGGAVGGVAAIALLGGVIGFLVLKKKKDDRDITSPPPVNPNQGYGAPVSTMDASSRPLSVAPTVMSQSQPGTVTSMYGPPPGGIAAAYYQNDPQKQGYVSPTMTEMGAYAPQQYQQVPPAYDPNQQPNGLNSATVGMRGGEGGPGFYEAPGTTPQPVYELGAPAELSNQQQQPQVPPQSPLAQNPVQSAPQSPVLQQVPQSPVQQAPAQLPSEQQSPVSAVPPSSIQQSPVQSPIQPYQQSPPIAPAQPVQPAPPVQQPPQPQAPNGGWGAAWRQ